jgi:Uma2 family endonuclease
MSKAVLERPAVRPTRGMERVEDEESRYPASDGKPMGETEVHVKLLGQLLEILDLHFADSPDVYVGGNMLIYYVPGNNRKHISPDLFVVKGIVKKRRRVYRVWVEGKAPDFILELLSEKTKVRDKGRKKLFYQDRFQTSEYFLFDPDTEELTGYRRVEGKYRPLRPDERGRLYSEQLGLTFGVDRTGWLRAYRPDGTVLRTLQEIAEEVAEMTEALAERDAKIARLQAELERIRGP